MHKPGDLVFNACIDWEPVQVLEDMAHMVATSKSLQEAGGIVLHKLQTMELPLGAPT